MPENKIIHAQGRQYMPATFDLSSIDTAKRTVDVTFATERQVLMYNWREGGLIKEILVCEDSAGDLSRLNNGGPLCDTHRTYSVKDGLGVVVKAWFEGGKGRATVRFSKRADVETVWQDVQDGIITGISVGYKVSTYETTEREGEIPLYRAVKWEALEISLALVQADADAAIGRNFKEEKEYTIQIIKNSNMPETIAVPAGTENQQRSGAETVVTVVPAQQAAAAAPSADDIRKDERKRSLEITKACRMVNLPQETIDELIGSEHTLDQCRGLIIDKAYELANKNGGNASVNVQTGVQVTADETDKRRTATEVAMCIRSGSMQEKDFKTEQVQAAREFRGMTLMDHVKDSLVRMGVSERDIRLMTAEEAIKRSITSSTSDFPILLDGTARRTLLAAYQSIPDTWRQWCAVGSVNDFRTHKLLRLGALSRLDSLTENGDIKTKALNDATAEPFSADTFANKINISRKMIINDDLAGFTRLANDLGRAAARGIELDAYAVLVANPVLTDGVALFHATHGNLGTGGAMTVASFDELRVKMAKQKDPNSQDFINLRPSVLLCDVAYGGDARVINEAQYDPDTANKLQRPNKSRGLFTTIVDSPQINGTAYYAFANPSDEPVIQVSFLKGVQTPYLESMQSWDQLGMEWRIYHDYGVDAVGFRGAVKNAGA